MGFYLKEVVSGNAILKGRNYPVCETFIKRRFGMNQNSMILNHLNTRPITPMEAYETYGILRLSARIHDLRNQGYSISMELKTAKNRFGASVTFAEYRLESE